MDVMRGINTYNKLGLACVVDSFFFLFFHLKQSLSPPPPQNVQRKDLNNAEDFQRMGGIDLCMHALSSSHTSVQWRAADCLASASEATLPATHHRN